jgi:ribose-phosphate pyrophosphokinase
MDLNNLIVVAPDVGSIKMASKFAEHLKIDIAIVDKRRIDAEKVAANALIGDVSEKNVLLVDDICSTGGTLKMAARVCKQRGAKSVRAFISHGLLIGDALEGADIDHIYVTNSVPRNVGENHPKVTYVSIAPLFKQAIERILTAKSISSLFKS